MHLLLRITDRVDSNIHLFLIVKTQSTNHIKES